MTSFVGLTVSKYVALAADKKMVYIEATNDSIGQNVKLENGKTYTISFKYQFTAGSFADDNVRVVVKDQMKGTSKFKTHLSSINASDFIITPLAGYTGNKYTFTWAKDTGTYAVGFSFINRAKTTKLNVADFSLTESSAPTLNLLTECNSTNGLLGWVFDWSGAAAGATEITNATKSASATITAKLADYDDTLFAVVSPKMMYIEATTDTLAQNVVLEKDKTYTISFKYIFTSGSFKDDNVRVVVKDQIYKTSKYKTYLSSLNAADFTVAPTDVYSGNSYTFTWNQNSGTYAIGFNFIKRGITTKMNIADFAVTESATPDVNLAVACNSSNMLRGWSSDWFTADSGASQFTNGTSYTVNLVDYNVNSFKTSKTMMYIEGSKDSMAQNVSLEKGRTYKLSFKYKFLGGSFDADYVRVVIKDQIYKTGKYSIYLSSYNASDFSVSTAKDFSENSYTFTWNKDSGKYAIGLNFVPRGTTKMYVADMMLSESSDSNVNLLKETNYQNGLAGWCGDWFAAENMSTQFVCDSSFKINLVDYDDSMFRITGKTMLCLDGKSDTIGQNVTLEKGKTYTVSFKYQFELGSFDYDYLRVVVKDQMFKTSKFTTHLSSLNASDFTVSAGKEYRQNSYTFTWSKDTGGYAVGLSFVPRGSTKVYIADMKLSEASNPNVNLMKENTFINGLAGWYSDWTAAADASTEFVNGTSYKLTLMSYDDSLFKISQEVVQGPRRMLYIQNQTDYHQIIQQVKLVANKTYYFKASVASSVQLLAMVYHKGERVAVFNGLKPITKVQNDNYYTQTFKFTMPATVGSEPLDLQTFVGLQFPASSTGYVFDFELWEDTDVKATNMFNNPTFSNGLDWWCYSWGPWFISGRQGLGQTEYSKTGEYSLNIMDFDQLKFIEYVDDSRYNDGEWWNAADVSDEQLPQYAGISGTLLNSNGLGLGNIKLTLASADREYTTNSDSHSKFSFKNIPVGFYELFATDSNGNRVYTGFKQTLESGDAVTAVVKCVAVAVLEEKIPVFTLRATVYNAARETLSGITVNIRGVGDATTDENGVLEVANLPEGDYELYTILENGFEYAFKTVTIKENIAVKLKYDPSAASNSKVEEVTDEVTQPKLTNDESSPILMIVLFSALALVTITFVLILLARRRKKA